MLRSLLSLLLSLTVFFAFAQNGPHACGQVNTPEQIAFLKANNPNLNLAFRPSMDTIRVPVLFQRIADENGNGAVSLADCANALVDLNALYVSGRIVFEECEPPRLIADSAFYDYQYSEEFALRQAHEVSGVINVFIPNRASSTSGGQVCGYAYLPPTRRDITIVKASCFTNGTTFPHEVGHFLGLYHTHGTSNCGSLTDELVDGSNCDTRGDDVCDTPADPNLLGVDCDGYVVNSSCVYTGTEVDANGDSFAPDPRNIMSYSRKACREGFSAGQLDRVRFFLGTSRSYLTCPVSVCESTVPAVMMAGETMTTISIEFDDNGQDRTEVDYFVVGGQARGLSTPDLNVELGGFYPCDSVMIRARNICPNGSLGDWSPYISAVTNGCGLRYCAQPGTGSEVLIEELGVNGSTLPSLQTAENYGIHSGQQTIVLDPASPMLSINATFDGNSNPAHFQVWIDFDNNSTFDSDELIVQERVSDGVNYSFTHPIDLTVSRGVPIRARFTVSQEIYVDPCEIELGETEDVDLVFQGGLGTVEWTNGTLSLDAPAQSIAVPLSGNVNWTVSGLPSWISASTTSGSANDTEFNFSADRNEDCSDRTATLVIDSGNGLSDELVVTQSPAAPGISLSITDTVYVGPLEGAVQFTSESLHRYGVASSDNWLPFMKDDLLDLVSHQLDYPINPDTMNRIGHINTEGCGAASGFVLMQESGRTSWGDPTDVQLLAIGDTVKLDVVSNVDWDASTTAPWLSALGIAGSGNGRVMYIYIGGAQNGETAEISLNGFFGSTEGNRIVTVTAPTVSSVSSPRLSAKLIMANPISDRLTATTVSAQTYNWSVYSSLGQRMHSSFGESLNIETTQWPAGTYLLKLEDESGRMLTERFVKF
ncbi:MAG: BACON domain-containing carbohydrate-binding protein [Saprospiraceae bacterium]